MADSLVKKVRNLYDSQGRFTGHFHTMTFGLLAMADYGLVVHDEELLDFVRKGYEFAKTEGSPLVGYFPEYVRQRPSTCESCEVAEMVALAVKLNEASVGD